MIVWLCYEATNRLIHPELIEIEAPIMIATAFISLGCNIFNLVALGELDCLCKKKKKEEAASAPEPTEE